MNLQGICCCLRKCKQCHESERKSKMMDYKKHLLAGFVIGSLVLGGCASGSAALASSAQGAAVEQAVTQEVGDEAEDQAEGSDVAITGEALELASNAALEYLGEGRVTDTEVGDEEGYYEIEVTLDDGTEVDVHLDESFNVLSQESDAGEMDDIFGEIRDFFGADDEAEGEDVAITGAALEKASAAALDYIGEGRVTDTEVGDEEGYYEVEVTLDDGSQVDVHLTEDLSVIGQEADDDSVED